MSSKYEKFLYGCYHYRCGLGYLDIPITAIIN